MPINIRFYAVSIRRSSMGRTEFFSIPNHLIWAVKISGIIHTLSMLLGAAAVGVNSMPYFNITLRSNNLPSSNFSLETPSYNRRMNPGIHDPFPHSSSASCASHSNYIQGGPSCYDGFAVNSHMDYERAPYKRKTQVIPMVLDRGNNSYHSAGNSSTLSVSSVNLQANPTSAPQHFAWDPIGMPSNYRSNNLLTVGEGSQRNVRSRQSLALHLGNNQTGVHRPSSNLPSSSSSPNT